MPFLHAKIASPDIHPAMIGALQEGLLALATGPLGKVNALTSILIEPMGPAAWFVGGAPQVVAAQVEISVTLGTNTADEKAAFIAGTYALLRELLGPALSPATYVAVHEIAPDAWGFDGKTVQAHRLHAAAGVEQ